MDPEQLTNIQERVNAAVSTFLASGAAESATNLANSLVLCFVFPFTFGYSYMFVK
jgi:hypothetical protein